MKRIGTKAAASLALAACAPQQPPAPLARAGCIQISAAEAKSFEGLELLGTSGEHRIYGDPRRLLCSEPGVGGRGECELIPPTQIRIEAPSGTYGFRGWGTGQSILTYAPTGVTCRPR